LRLEFINHCILFVVIINQPAPAPLDPWEAPLDSPAIPLDMPFTVILPDDADEEEEEEPAAAKGFAKGFG
jgi:hypothetical protein